MKTLSTLLLTGALAVLAPVSSLAQGNGNVLISKTSGSLRVEISSVVGDVTAATPMISGRVEIAEGPNFPQVGKLFVLTRVDLHFANFFIRSGWLGNPLPLVNVGAQLRDAIVFWAIEAQPGVFKIEIPPDAIHITGDPTFIGSAKVDDSYFDGHEKIEQRFFSGPDRISEPIIGTIDMNTMTFHATAVVKGVQEIKGFIEVERKLTITLGGPLVPAACYQGAGGAVGGDDRDRGIRKARTPAASTPGCLPSDTKAR
jgi:hypothetical protein